MTRFSFNPFHKLNSNISNHSWKELILAQQRRINEITAAIQQAESYLEKNPDSKPVTWRLRTLRKDYSKVCKDLAKSERSLAELLERMEKGR